MTDRSVAEAVSFITYTMILQTPKFRSLFKDDQIFYMEQYIDSTPPPPPKQKQTFTLDEFRAVHKERYRAHLAKTQTMMTERYRAHLAKTQTMMTETDKQVLIILYIMSKFYNKTQLDRSIALQQAIVSDGIDAISFEESLHRLRIIDFVDFGPEKNEIRLTKRGKSKFLFSE